ncbi:MAG: GIY-YIG nuclease family protein [Chloroflexi bacterium]|nr:GIY-YIG nuclease family protein [Chloroflexota bacterium]
MTAMFFVYVLQSQKNNRYYIGSTKDIDQRVSQHNAGISKSTRNYRPWRLVYSEPLNTLAQARQRESQLKA